ncbi:MAG: neuraminidase (sialidase) [Deltaproteobacteria bacterium]|nr:neuraminidase (sialidase) [Deltaproteobacteria bacterium]
MEPGTAENITRTHVFGDLRPFSQCHASTLVRRSDGQFLVAWFAGTREGHPDVGIWAAEGSLVSSRGARPGDVFHEPRRIAKVRDEPHWNPVLFALEPGGGDFVLHFKVGTHIRSWQTWMQRSRDGGRSWSNAVPLVPGDRGGRGAVRNKPIRLASGDWLAGASLEGWRHWKAFIDRSPDGLGDWEATKPIAIDRSDFAGKGLIQPSLWESQPGRVHALLRSTDGRVHRSDSDDAGHSWSTARAIDVPNNNSGLDVVRLRDGTLALACNPVAGNRAARSPLSLLFSRDEGETWPARIDVETDPGEFSYPALIEDGDGLALAYTWNRRRIVVAPIDASRIATATEAPPHASQS